MGTTFPFRKHGKGAFLVLPALTVGVGIVAVGGLVALHQHHAPARIENLLAIDAEGHFSGLARYGGGGETAVGIKDGDKTTCHKVIHVAFDVGQRIGRNTSGDDGMVVGHL